MSNGGQRLITALVYLNEVSKGGGTQFTRIIDASGERLTINPEPGKMLMFYNCKKNTNGRHILSGHANIHNKRRGKWAFNLWFRGCHEQKIMLDLGTSLLKILDLFNI